jgi:hypothetical protein
MEFLLPIVPRLAGDGPSLDIDPVALLNQDGSDLYNLFKMKSIEVDYLIVTSKIIPACGRVTKNWLNVNCCEFINVDGLLREQSDCQ